MNNRNNMNNQGFQHFGNNFQYVQTPEQLAELQKKQQLLMQQQQMYLQEQQRMQKQFMREEQRNRLKNMNIKSMGVSTFNQPTVMSSSHHPTPRYSSSPNPTSQSNYYQPAQPYSSNNYLPPAQNNSFTAPQSVYNSVPASVQNKGNQLSNNSFAPVNPSFTSSNVPFSNPISTFNNPVSAPVSNTSFNSSFPSDDLIGGPTDDTDDFGDFATTHVSPPQPTVPSSDSSQLFTLTSDSVNSFTPISVLDKPVPVNPMIPQSVVPPSHSLLVSTESKPPTPPSLQHQESDEFDDFQAASFNSTPAPSSSSQHVSPDAYVPGTLKNEDSDVIPSVTIFSNPIKPEPSAEVSEFDNLIMKSLSGKSTKSAVKSLFKPAQKPSIPSVYSGLKPSETAADWSSLSVGDMFQTSQPLSNLQHFDCSIVSSNSLVLEPSSSVFNDSDNLVSVDNDQDLISDDFDDFVSTPRQQTSTPVVTSTTADLFSIFSSVPTPAPDLTPKPLDLITTSSEVDQEWSDFSFTPSKATTTHKKPSPAVDVDKLPSLYRDIIKFCDTPSGIIDVGKVYDIMLTEKFKVVAIQPLMAQCNMMESPKVKDLVDLIGIVGLRQKGFPTPSKYELDYRKLPIPAVNTKLLKNAKSKTKSKEQPTLLSFVQNDTSSVAKKDPPALAPVFDFGFSSSKNLFNAPFAKDSTEPAETDEWGDFGEVVAKVDKKETTLWPDFEISSSNKPTSVPQDLLSVQTADLQIPKKVAPPKNFDEPPPLSEDDDEDWAEFSHPASKWNIDLDQIEEESKNNIVTKNRWGSTATSTSKPQQDKEYIPDKTFSDVNIDISKTPSDNNDLFAGFSSKKPEIPKSDIDSNMSDLFSVEQTSKPSLQNAEKPARNDVDMYADFYSGNSLAKPSSGLVTDVESSKTSHDNDIFADFTSNVSTKPQSSLGILETSAKDNGESLKDKDFDATRPAFDFVDQDVTKFDSPFTDFDSNTEDLDDFSDFKTTEANTTSDNFISPFADFTDSKQEETVEENIEEVTEEPAIDPIAESLKLTNLPKKDLDGFWTDMVDSLGPQNPTSNIAPPVVVKKQEVSDFEGFAQFPQIVSYDALKESFDNEEDRVGAWSKCLSMVLTILIQCQAVFAAASSTRTKGEVIGSTRGSAYLDCCKAVFKVACRISLAGSVDDGIVEIFKEIKHTWSLISEMLDENTELPTIRDFNIQGSEEDSLDGECGICLLGTTSNEPDKLRYNGISYHVTCANLWINTVNPLLPDLTARTSRPLL